MDNLKDYDAKAWRRVYEKAKARVTGRNMKIDDMMGDPDVEQEEVKDNDIGALAPSFKQAEALASRISYTQRNLVALANQYDALSAAIQKRQYNMNVATVKAGENTYIIKPPLELIDKELERYRLEILKNIKANHAQLNSLGEQLSKL